jgi:immune inhibitor A
MMIDNRRSGPQFVSPAPEVLRQIQESLADNQLSAGDVRSLPRDSALALEPTGVPGLNSGEFYPPDYDGPERAAGPALGRSANGRRTIGSLRCLVLLVDFVDNQGLRPVQDFEQLLFSQNPAAPSSMRDYYVENSYGQLDVDGAVVEWIRLPEPYGFYVNGESGTGPFSYPNNAKRMVEDALQIAAQTVDFSQFDLDGDGFLDGLFVVAGGGAEAETDPNLRKDMIWSHKWSITTPFVAAGTTAFTYFTAPEDGRVGVFSHEFGHMLGLPDLYDTTDLSHGVGDWCVMGRGSWNNFGLTPGHMCTWSKAQLGWLQPNPVSAAQALTLPGMEQDAGASFRVWTGGQGGSEYFLLENRLHVGFDAFLPGQGLLIWHIDETRPNNDAPGPYRVAVEQADGDGDLEAGTSGGDPGDPWPGSDGATHFDGDSVPSSARNNGAPTGVSVSGIAVTGAVANCNVVV